MTDTGYNRYIQIDEEKWLSAKEDLKATESILGLPTVLRINQPIFRDKKRVSSVELKDYRERDDFDAQFVAELEHFNPERHPILHAITDVPIWALKNRILRCGPKEME